MSCAEEVRDEGCVERSLAKENWDLLGDPSLFEQLRFIHLPPDVF